MKRKIMSVVLSMFMIFSVMLVHVYDVSALESTRTVLDSGTCGEKATWTLYDDGLLEIGGTGAMNDGGPQTSGTPFTFVTSPWDSQCEKVTRIVIDEGITHVGDFAFAGCTNVTDVSISSTVTSLGWSSFNELSKLESISIPDSVKEIGELCFGHCTNLKYIKLPNGLKKISSDLFNGCNSLESINIPESVTELSWQAFADCTNLKKVVLPEGITELGEWTFYLCSSLEEVNIPSSVTTLRSGVFAGCKNLKSVVIPKSVTAVDYGSEKREPFEKDTVLKVYGNSFGLNYAKEKGYKYEIIPEYTTVTPSIDTSKDVKDATVGINNTASKEVVEKTTKDLVENIIQGKEVTGVNKEVSDKVKKAVEEGKTISTTVETKTLEESSLTKDEKTKINEAIKELEKKNKSTVYKYLDLSVLLKVDNEVLTPISQLNEPIEFTVKLPSDLIKENRKYSIIRIHNGKTDILDTVLNDNGTLTFKTNQFSTYAIVYTDELPTIQPTTNKDVNKDKITLKSNTKESPKTASKTSVKTGDQTSLMTYVCMSVLSLFAIVYIAKKKAKKFNS